MDKLPLTRPYFDQEELDEIRSVLDSGWVAQGPKVREFESAVAEYLGVRHAVAVTNCTAALHLALLALGIGPGDEVLVADYTFPATGHAVLYCGARPVFIDIDPLTYNLDPGRIEESVTPKTRAIVPVHTFGQPAAMDSILEIADDHGLAVVEDAACALGARYRGRYAGTIGDVSCFSFHARKGITTGEGGMLVTDRDEIAAAARHLAVFGMTAAWDREKSSAFAIPEFTEIGYNYKMSDITAAVGVAQMRRLDAFIERRRELARIWDAHLDRIDGITRPFIDPDAEPVYQSYVALVDRGVDRNRLIEMVMAEGVQTQIGTYASHIQPVYRSHDRCDRSLDVYRRAIALPLYVTLREEEIDAAARILARTLGELQ
ncbi:DegT/DnrJ/EryC1/StrS family aminotransferase [Methanoculleus sp. FWC-SCC1]|uniref:DegT/DnrJ/EryC1/StrS family aminotransferase n=1 Tax=Methanoculleus frigidifontis TaxID=2584085 RepID=A0ABT8M7R6_9EURY|nr:DegT/DnrJ/EryC1/StrS family aminotransferase [Methanoculleus sp. FWC-SCC1]MDN7023944.1 DegT/DnrJ/EryC1/StrS family aminotransferase [Methanoculleus sp. FWC-SCC1]